MNGIVLPSPAAGGLRALDPVPADAEFERIRRLPRRRWTKEAMEDAAERLTPTLLNSVGLALWQEINHRYERAGRTEAARIERDAARKKFKIHLKLVQAAFLVECFHMRGAFGSLPVGAGKSLIAWAIALLFDGLRTLLVVPGGLKAPENNPKRRGKTEKDFEEFVKYWREPKVPIKLGGYEYIAHKNHPDYLEKIDARVYVFDECDFLKDPGSGRTRRIIRHLNEHPDRLAFFETGSMQRKSIDDYRHLVIAALRDRAPVPVPWHVADTWKSALDYSPKGGIRRRPGALLQLAADVGIAMPSDDHPDSAYNVACDGYYHRLADTPGMFMWSEQSCDQPLRIRILKPPDDPIIEKAFYNFRGTKKTPCGYDVSSNFSLAAHGQELASGFYNRPKVPPPEPWKEARREYHKALREAIAESWRLGHPLDTESQAVAFIRSSPLAKDEWLEAVRKWDEISPTYEWESEPVWISPSVLVFAAEWIRAHPPSLIWTKDIAVGEALELMTGVSYYGAGGRNKKKHLIDDLATDVDKDGFAKHSAIVSVKANERGRNLQTWNWELVFAPPQPEDEWEQAILGRVHRQGQEREVNVDVIVSSADSLYCLNEACKVARDIERKQHFTHKILSAEWDWSSFPAWAAHGALLSEEDPRRSRWNRGA